MVLLNVDWMCAMPVATFFRTTFFAARFLVAAMLNFLNYGAGALKSFLGACHGTFARTLPGARVGVSALAIRRQPLSVSEPAIAA